MGAYAVVVVFILFVLANLIIIGARFLGNQRIATIVVVRLGPVVHLFRLGDPAKDSADHSSACS
jgi:hypothetical protein